MASPVPLSPHAETIDRFVHTGDLDSAHGLALVWIQQEPSTVVAWTRLASIRARQGHRQDAIEALNRAIALIPDEPSFHHLVGVQHYALGEFQQAADAFAASLTAGNSMEDNPYDTLSALALAQSHAKLGNAHDVVLALRPLDEESTMWLSGRVTPASVRQTLRDQSVEKSATP